MAGDVCGGCGTDVVDGAHFCHVCGERVDVEPIVFDVYGAERGVVRSSGPSATEPSRSKALAAVLALTVVFFGGLAMFNLLTSGDTPTAEPPDTTTPPSTVGPTTSVQGSSSVAVPATLREVDGPLWWHPGPEIGALSPVGIVEYAGQVLFFASEPDLLFGPGARWLGLTAWRSSDGVLWESLGTVIDPPNELSSVAAAPEGMAAVGRSPEGTPVIWRSVDGTGWAMEVLPEPPSSTSDEPFPAMSASIGGIDVVVGISGLPNYSTRFYQAVQELTGSSLVGLSFNFIPRSESKVEIRGPFGLPLISLSAEDLGLTQDDLRFAANGGRTQHSAVVWTSTGGADWQVSTLDQIFPISLDVTSDRFVLAGLGPAGSQIWMSDDGIVWQDKSDGPISALSVVSWGQKLVATWPQNSIGLAVSEDGIAWTTIDLAGILPDDYQIRPDSVTAGDNGVAAAATESLSAPDPQQPAVEAILVKDGYTLTANESGVLVLRQGEEILLTTSGISDSQDHFISDLGEGTITFLDPTTSEPYITFTLDELRQLETAAGYGYTSVTQRSLILYTPDTKMWSINDVTDIAPGNTTVRAMKITSIGLITAITTNPKGEPSTTNPPATQVYIGLYPN